MDINEKIGLAAELACLFEVSAEKPGNVTPNHDFSDTKFEDFLTSGAAIGRSFRNILNSSVGETILQAVKDTRALTGVNTNLGIILLLAPLAKACTHEKRDNIRSALRTVLKELSVRDAELAYEAIRIVNPGGLGKVKKYDVKNRKVDITLLEAMSEACGRDSIAREYVTDFETTFETGLPALRDALDMRISLFPAIIQTFLIILSRIPDTLISRKKGKNVAQDISNRSKAILDSGGVLSPDGREKIKNLDRFLRDEIHSLNPGTTADLTASVLFVYLMENDLKVSSYV